VAWSYVNPVNIHFGVGSFKNLREKINGRKYCITTYGDNKLFEDLTAQIVSSAGQPVAIVKDIAPNPSFENLQGACATYASASAPPEVIVALGGGSVIDTAKVLAAAGGDFPRVQRYLEGETDGSELLNVPIIAIPTTAGTGSEVTCWATVWDMAKKKKYSLARPGLYPEFAIVDPTLTQMLPRSLTISTGLDALSHALESIWNVNANPVSANHAVAAATAILEFLPRLADDLSSLELRENVARAAIFAGLAFSNTKTALAHSLSYHLTMHHGTVHGIACSFTLPAILRSVAGRDRDCDASLKRIFGNDLEAGAVRLETLLRQLGVSTDATDYGVTKHEWRSVIDEALMGERGRNFIGQREAVLANAA